MNSKGSSVSSDIEQTNIAKQQIQYQYLIITMQNSNPTQDSSQHIEQKPHQNKQVPVNHQKKAELEQKQAEVAQHHKEQKKEQVKQQPIQHPKQPINNTQKKHQQPKEKQLNPHTEEKQTHLKNEEKKENETQHQTQLVVAQKQPQVKKLTQEEIQKLIQQFKKTKGFENIGKTSKQITSLLALAKPQSQSLQINLGIGQNKGKTNIKYSIDLKEKCQQKFRINIEVKIKKKSELKALIESQIKRALKVQGYHPYKLTNFTFTQTEKTLIIHIQSPTFEQLLKETIDQIQQLYNKQVKPILKLQGELYIKNSIRQDDTSLQKKRFIKWLGEGFTTHLAIQGSRQVIHHFTSILEEYFPIFKVIRSGEINLKLKSIASIDKLFDKLGINQISQQTPTLSHFATQVMKEYLHSQSLPWVDLIKRCIFFSSTIPNQKINIDINVSLSHLLCSFSVSCQGCKQLGQIANANQVFS